MDAPGYPPDVIQSYKLYQHIKYMNLVSLCILICEWFNTLEVEVAVIWTPKWGVGNALYMFSRLLPFFDVPLVIFYRLYPHVPTLPNHVCSVLYKIETWSTVFGIIASEIILIMMVYGLANDNKVIGWWLGAQVLLFGAGGCALWGILLQSLQFGEPALPLPTGCYVTGGKYLFAGIGFIVLALNEFILMVVVLGVGFYRYRNSNNTLVRTLYRDGIFYYVFLFLISMGEVIVILAGPPEYADLLTTIQRVAHSILAARVMLNVRATARSDLNARSSGQRVSSMKFGKAQAQASGSSGSESYAMDVVGVPSRTSGGGGGGPPQREDEHRIGSRTLSLDKRHMSI